MLASCPQNAGVVKEKELNAQRRKVVTARDKITSQGTNWPGHLVLGSVVCLVPQSQRLPVHSIAGHLTTDESDLQNSDFQSTGGSTILFTVLRY